MISRTYVDPKCYKCGKNAYKVRISDNALVCREHEYTEDTD